MENSPLSFLIVDDHPLFRFGVGQLICTHYPEATVNLAENGLEALEKFQSIPADLVLMDIDMPLLNGLETAEKMLGISKGVKIILLSMHDNQRYAKKMLSLGCKGYVTKESTMEEMIVAVQAVLAGNQYLSYVMANRRMEGETTKVELSQREIDVLKLLTEGKSNKEIGGLLGISPRTVDAHRANLIKKTKVEGLSGLVLYAVKQGYISV